MAETTDSGRDYSLDALRGFAILTMILSGRVPWGVLPGWMYHVQVPPPAHKFDPSIPGISWVDLVFPFFLFSMGAAFPFALSKKLEKAKSAWNLMSGVLWRGVLLMFFALVIFHIRPHILHKTETTATYILAISLFALLFLIFLRYPSGWSKTIVYTLKSISAVILILFLALFTFSNGEGFSFRKYDIIILVLSNVAVAGSVIWIFTRANLMSKLFIMAVLLGIRLGFNTEGSWIALAGKEWPGYLLFQLTFLKYLFIIIPGMIAGDILYTQSKAKTVPEEKLSAGLVMILIISAFGLILISLIGLYIREVFLTVLLSALVLAGMYALLKNSGEYLTQKYLRLFLWGAAWIMVGLVFEPFEGGIKKDPSTMSYYLLTSGLAIMMLIGFSLLFNHLHLTKYFSLLIDSGKNPMLAYAAGTNLLTPLVMLTGIQPLLIELLPGMWPGVLRGIILTLLLALMVMFFTRKNLFWRT
ncbi:MAG: DUF5009 domain-containing protein [Ignavibacteriales bacterium]|nr:MAG: DUF5009 domain-containing protein [Ignavibacteriales bacterium]